MADQLNANLSRFSAYKAAHVEKAFNDILNDPKMTDEQRRVAVRAAEEKFARWTDAEYNTATARCITAEQFAEFNDPEHTSLFPNLEWLATRSTNPREEHQAFVGLILPKSHDFWRTHTPGTEWNCKCDLAETDDPATKAANLPTAKVPKGLEGNPFYTGEVFTNKVGYLRNAAATIKDINSMGRNKLKTEFKSVKETVQCVAGTIKIDGQSYAEIAQANICENAYWLKIEIAKNFERYANRLVFQKSEAVDLNHNKYGSKAYKRKKGFRQMNKYHLTIGNKTFIVKMGECDNGDLMLYTIYQK